MSNNWITVSNKNKNKNKTIIINNNNNPKNKPKLKNDVKEKILKYCNINNNDFEIFKSWQHFYIMGNITKNNSIYRIENKLLLLEYFNKFKIYKNYKKGNENEFIQLINQLNITKKILYENMVNNQLFYNNILLHNHPLFIKIYNLQKQQQQQVQVHESTQNKNVSFLEILKKNI